MRTERQRLVTMLNVKRMNSSLIYEYLHIIIFEHRDATESSIKHYIRVNMLVSLYFTIRWMEKLQKIQVHLY